MLDIIIPTYKDIEGLRRTLKSTHIDEYNNWIKVTVIDDCSPIKPVALEKEFPHVKFYYLPQNHGPGFARQYGINHTSEPYFTFIDCGDEFISKYSLLEIADHVNQHPSIYLFLFPWINEQTHTVSTSALRSTQGWVYKREFFQKFTVKFCADPIAGYANEDIGFNRTCIAITRHLQRKNNRYYSSWWPVPTTRKIFNETSITNTNNYRMTRQLPGICINTTLSINLLEKNKIDEDIIIEELVCMTCSLYKNFLRCAKSDPIYAYDHWAVARKFYLTTFKKYEQSLFMEPVLMKAIAEWLHVWQRYVEHPNLRKFLQDLNDNEECPKFYYNL